MRQYFSLLDDMSSTRRWHLGAAFLADGTEPRLRAGLPFDSVEKPTIAVSHAGFALDFSLTSFSVPVMSERLSLALAPLVGSDVQWVPVDVAGHGRFKVPNVVRVLRCVDEVRSTFVKWTRHDHRADLAGSYRQITKLVVEQTAIPADVHMFRIEGSLVEVVVSEDARACIVEGGFTGAEFARLTA